MLRDLLKSKIHRATVTESNLEYIGSLTIDADLLRAADLVPNEKVHVVNATTGARFETYCLEGKAASGTICANGGAARLCAPGDVLIILAYGMFDEAEVRAHAPRVVFVDARNRRVPEGTSPPRIPTSGASSRARVASR